jgi:hypothetical protein
MWEQQHDLVQTAEPKPSDGSTLARWQWRLECHAVWSLEHTQRDRHQCRIGSKHASIGVHLHLQLVQDAAAAAAGVSC